MPSAVTARTSSSAAARGLAVGNTAKAKNDPDGAAPLHIAGHWYGEPRAGRLGIDRLQSGDRMR